ncbi:MAG: hypothetical protein FDX21_06575 [Chlorobium sp.]|nr:MAG: hypothetical protein FDX21_06575 [Chlorobium sp.]
MKKNLISGIVLSLAMTGFFGGVSFAETAPAAKPEVKTEVKAAAPVAKKKAVKKKAAKKAAVKKEETKKEEAK